MSPLCLLVSSLILPCVIWCDLVTLETAVECARVRRHRRSRHDAATLRPAGGKKEQRSMALPAAMPSGAWRSYLIGASPRRGEIPSTCGLRDAGERSTAVSGVAG